MTRTLSTLIGIAAALALLLALGSGEPLREVRPFNHASLRQSYLEDAVSWRFDDSGQRTQRITVASGEQLVNRPSIRMGNLSFEGRDTNGRSWRIDAGAGILLERVDELQLLEGVVIRESEGLGTLETPRMRVFLNDERAESTAPVILTTADSTTRAVGLDVDLKAGTVHLLSRVETIYEP